MANISKRNAIIQHTNKNIHNTNITRHETFTERFLNDWSKK
jgi:hypothetical protein